MKIWSVGNDLGSGWSLNFLIDLQKKIGIICAQKKNYVETRETDPMNIHEKLTGEKNIFCKEVTVEEFDNKTWNIVNNPGNRMIIKTQWLFKPKKMKMALYKYIVSNW